MRVSGNDLCELKWEVTKISHNAIRKIQVAKTCMEVSSIVEEAVNELRYIFLDCRITDLLPCDIDILKEDVEESSNEIKEARWTWAVKQLYKGEK